MRFKIFFLVSFFVSSLLAQNNPYILTHDGLIDQRAQDKILEIGNEVKKKLNINLYVDIKENNGIDPELPRPERKKLMKQKDQEIINKVKKPYAVLVLSIDQLYSNILSSKDVASKLDKDDILDGYVIPLLASKDKNSLFAKTSAATLNGFAQMADSIAKKANIKLESSIGSEGKTAGTIWRVFMYSLVLIGIFLYAVIILRERKYKNK